MTDRLRVVMFGDGGRVSAACLQATAADHDVLGVVRAARRGRARYILGRLARRLGPIARDVLSDAARALGTPEWPVASMRDEGLRQRLASLAPDVISVAHFPWRLPEGVLSSAGLASVNLHASLLPRHRGPLPLFWVYHSDDRETGVTVHHMSEEFDRGDIIAQRSFPLPRGYPADDLNARNAEVGAALLRDTLAALAGGSAGRQQQDEARATTAPLVVPGRAMVPFDDWDVERVWHFLAGVWPRFIEPLTDGAGQPVRYGGVAGYARQDAAGPIGRVTRHADGLLLQCRDGCVRLREAPAVAPGAIRQIIRNKE